MCRNYLIPKELRQGFTKGEFWSQLIGPQWVESKPLQLCSESIASGLLTQLLRRAGHDVQLPADVGLGGKADAQVFRHTITAGRVVLSRNHRDFEHLHLLVLASGGHHPGVLVERFDNDPNHRMTPREIVRAVRNIEAAGFLLRDEYQVLNLWQ